MTQKLQRHKDTRTLLPNSTTRYHLCRAQEAQTHTTRGAAHAIDQKSRRCANEENVHQTEMLKGPLIIVRGEELVAPDPTACDRSAGGPNSKVAKVGPLRARVKSAKVRPTPYVYYPRVAVGFSSQNAGNKKRLRLRYACKKRKRRALARNVKQSKSHKYHYPIPLVFRVKTIKIPGKFL
jgi:hypothetical protein